MRRGRTAVPAAGIREPVQRGVGPADAFLAAGSHAERPGPGI